MQNKREDKADSADKVLSKINHWLDVEVRKNVQRYSESEGIDKAGLSIKQARFEASFEDEYLKELYQSWLPELLAARVSLADLDLQKCSSFLEKEKLDSKNAALFQQGCRMLWHFLVAFAIKSGATLQDIADKMQAIYDSCSQLRSRNLPYEHPDDSNLPLKGRIEKTAYIYFYRLLIAFRDENSAYSHFSPAEVVLTLRTNPDLLKLVHLQNGEYQFLDARIMPLNGRDNIVYYDHEQKRFNPNQDPRIVGRTLCSWIALKQDPGLFHEVLNIMKENEDKGFSAQAVKNILELPVPHRSTLADLQIIEEPLQGDLLINACCIADDKGLFERMLTYTDQVLTEEYKMRLVFHAIYYDRISILEYLKNQLNFDMKAIGMAILVQYVALEKNPPHRCVAFLLDQGMDVNARLDAENDPTGKVEGDFYFLEHFLDPHRWFFQVSNAGRDSERFSACLDNNAIEIAIAFMERNVDLRLIKEHHEPGDIIEMFLAVLQKKVINLTNTKSMTDAARIELGNIACLQGWVVEKTQGQKEAESYYKMARQCGNFKREHASIKDSFKQLVREKEKWGAQLSPQVALFIVSRNSHQTEEKKYVSIRSSSVSEQMQSLFARTNNKQRDIYTAHQEQASQVTKLLQEAFFKYQSIKPEQKEEAVRIILFLLHAESSIKKAIKYCRLNLGTCSNQEKKIYRKVLMVLLEEAYIKKLRPFCDGQSEKTFILADKIDDIRNVVNEVSKFATALSPRQKRIVEVMQLTSPLKKSMEEKSQPKSQSIQFFVNKKSSSTDSEVGDKRAKSDVEKNRRKSY